MFDPGEQASRRVYASGIANGASRGWKIVSICCRTAPAPPSVDRTGGDDGERNAGLPKQGMHQLIHSRNLDGRQRESFPFQGVKIINNIRMFSAAILAGASLAAQAQPVDDMVPTHWRFGVQVGTVQDHANTEPAAQVSLGYDIDRTWSVEALANVSLIFMRIGGLNAGEHEFDGAVGARVLATLPVGERWSLVGGLGVVRFEDEVGTEGRLNNITQNKTSPMVSLAAAYRMSRRWSLGLEVSSFTQAHTFNAGLRGEFHF